MPWTVLYHEAFDRERETLSEAVHNELLARVSVLAEFGPRLGRPYADTLAGSRHANMKELRFEAADGVWRVAFASIPNDRRSCSSPGIRQASRRGGSISGSSPLPTRGSTSIWRHWPRKDSDYGTHA